MNKNKFMTNGDILGMRRLAKEAEGTYEKKNGIYVPLSGPLMAIESFEDLLKKDEQREKDGFPKKIKIGKVLAGPGKVIMVPYVEEEKLIHGEFEPKIGGDGGEEGEDGEDGESEGGDMAGHGAGEVGDVIGERSPEGDGDGDGNQAGQDPGEHGIEAEAYKIGKELTEKFQLPNLKEKGKKVPTDKYVFDLTDRHRGSGQVLDKKETLKSIVKTNISLGRLDKDNIETNKLVVSPNDKVYRVLSREKVWESQAVVFFLRDYSGSMYGKRTEIVVTQHLMIYSWLLYQYEKLVIPRFIVHDTEAKEVTVEKYYRASVSGGTFIQSAFKLMNDIVQNEGLDRDYNIYAFYGTDGEDFDDGRRTIPEIRKTLGYVARLGVCIIQGGYGFGGFKEYIEQEKSIIDNKELFRMCEVEEAGFSEDKNIEAIKKLIAQD